MPDALRSPAQDPVTPPKPEPTYPPASGSAQPVVLVVDDDAGVREALRLVLHEEYTVVDAGDGRTALALVRAQRVDLVLLDILMPDVDGLEILQELKVLTPDLPVIMTTAVKTVRTAVAAMKLGASDYVTKPFPEEELLAAMRRAIEQRASGVRAPARRTRPDREAQPPRTARLLLVGDDPGWRATLAVTLARVAKVERAATLIDGLNRMLRFRPSCVVLSVSRAPAEAHRFLGALNAQMPACPVLVVSDDAYLGAESVWETLNIRGVLRPPVNSRDLLDLIGDVLRRGDRDGGESWPRLGDAVSRTIDYLSQHFDRELTVDGIAEIIDISASHLAHLFRSETGRSVRDYLTRVRLAVAQDLLAGTDEKLDAIAARVGFVDTSHLAHVFQRITGKPPSAYRRPVR